MTEEAHRRTDDVRDSARDLIRRGFAPVPVPYRSKKCTVRNWPSLRIDARTVDRYFKSARGNVGVLLGEPSGWIVDVDLDDLRAVELAESFLPRTGMIWGRASKPRSHRLYRLARPACTRQWKSEAGTMLVELRCTGAQTVAPGSVHECGEPIVWYEDGDPTTLDPDTLTAAIEKLVCEVCFGQVKQHEPDFNRPDDPIVPIVPIIPVVPIRVDPADLLGRARVTGSRQHDSKTMMLARGLKFNAGLTPESARPWFERWWAEAAPHCRETDADAAWFKFERAWELAQIPLDARGVGSSVLAMADTLATVPEEAGFGPNLALLVRSLAEMGRRMGAQPFALSARMVARRFGVSEPTAHEWMKGLTRRGLIEVPDRGRPGANGTGRARRILWRGKST